MRNHHRTTFSVSVGLGVGLLVTELRAGEAATPAGIWTGGPLLVDVDSTVRSGNRPDLVIFDGIPTLGTPTYVLVCKGNGTARSETQRQQRAGIVQMCGLSRPSDRPRVGVAASGPRSASDVMHQVSGSRVEREQSLWRRGPEQPALRRARIRSLGSTATAASAWSCEGGPMDRVAV